MSSESLRVYFANMYTNILSQKGLEIMEKSSLSVGGNLLTGDLKKELNVFSPDVVIYSPTPEDIESGLWNEIKSGKYPFIMFSNFLDRDIGWNEREGYRFKPHKHFTEPLQSGNRIGQVLALSKHGAETIRKTYGLISEDTGYCYLGIDYHGIKQQVQENSESLQTKVLWDHMWRADKGFKQAFDIVKELSRKYPGTTFVINQKDSWRGSEEAIGSLKEHLSAFIENTSQQDNIVFNDRFSSRQLYYSFLASHNISFCVARIENFGFGMLEQSATGIATVVPNVACYPEMYLDYVCDLDNVGLFIESLIVNPELRASVAAQRQKVAESFDVRRRMPEFIERIKQCIR